MTQPSLDSVNDAITTRFTLGTSLISMNHMEQRLVRKTLITNYTPHITDMVMISFIIFVSYVVIVLNPAKEKMDKSKRVSEIINDVYRIKKYKGSSVFVENGKIRSY
jgi:hypothetical protein